MFRNYFRSAWRNLTRTIGYSALNIIGLAVGMAVALLIGLWVSYQYSFDKFLPGYQTAYRVQRNFNSNGDTLTFLSTSPRLAEVLRTQIPEVQYVALADNGGGDHGFIVNNKKYYEFGITADTDFLRIFPFPALEGNPDRAFRDAYSIVLTQSMAKALFGHEDPIGKTVRFDNHDNLKVTAVIRDVPPNSSFEFKYIIPTTYVRQAYPGSYDQTSFDNNGYQIFIKLRPGVSYAQVASKIRDVEHVEKGSNNAINSYVTFQPMARWHLYSKYVNGKDTAGFLEYVKMFSLIGLLVLIIACINFINLTTARSEKRAREVGVRKAIGSRKSELVVQFLFESLLNTLIAFCLSLVLVWLTVPPFNELTNSSITIPFSNVDFWLLMAGCILLTALLAGGRPAFYLSSFNPVRVLKGNLVSGRGASFSRKILVVIQFSCSIALIISTAIIYRQIQYARDRPTGYDLNRLVSTRMNDELSQHYTALKNDLLEKGIVTSVATSTSPPTDVWWHTDLERWPGKRPGETVEMGCIFVDQDYFKTLGMKIIEGRGFSGANDTTSVIFNEAAVKRLRLRDPVGTRITSYFGDRQYTVAGVVKNALMISPFNDADPTMFYCFPQPQNFILYSLAPGVKTKAALVQLATIFNKYDPSYPFDYSFADANYASKFQVETLIEQLAALFACLAIFISCLGLFGLAAYMAEKRTREIGIRKVLGASVQQIWLMLCKDFVLLVAISSLIASSLAFYFLQGWLENYSYRIRMGPGIFMAGAAVALLVTILTISYQAIKAAVANPVGSLRSE